MSVSHRMSHQLSPFLSLLGLSVWFLINDVTLVEQWKFGHEPCYHSTRRTSTLVSPLLKRVQLLIFESFVGPCWLALCHHPMPVVKRSSRQGIFVDMSPWNDFLTKFGDRLKFLSNLSWRHCLQHPVYYTQNNCCKMTTVRQYPGKMRSSIVFYWNTSLA